MSSFVILLQARTNSRRLPYKVLRPLGRERIPMLAHCIRRLKTIGPVVVTTSLNNNDNEVEELAKLEGVDHFRGSEDDVLDRFHKAVQSLKCRFIIRATGDNPFVDPQEAKRVLDRILFGDVDYVSGVDEVNGLRLPAGIGVEAFTSETIAQIWNDGHKIVHREHINEYIFDYPDAFRTMKIPCLPENSCPELRLTVDTFEDFAFAESIFAAFYKQGPLIVTEEIIEWWRLQSKF